MKLNHKLKLRIKIYAMAALAIVGTFLWFFYGRGILEFFFFTFLVGWILSCPGTIGTHRWLCHRSFEPSLFGKIIMMFGMIVESYGKPSQAVIAHRLHHKHTDQPGDPHSPRYKSFFQLWRGDFENITGLPAIKDFLRIKEMVWFDKHYWTLWWAFNLTIALFDWQLALIFSSVVFSRTWLFSTIVNYYAHSGKLAEPRNLHPFISYYTMGEGLHKNHHEQPNNYRFDRPGCTRDIGGDVIEYLLIKK